MARAPAMDDDDPMKSALVSLEHGGSATLPGGQVVNERTIFGDIITAQPIKVPRNEPNVLRRVDAMAQANGEAWYYRFPVKNRRTGRVDYIEGPSIECADAVARYYGNCQVQTALAAETPTQWIFASRFVDLETGYSLIRPFLQPKGGGRLGGDDDDRRLQMAFGIGTSKCQRNVVDHALADVMARAFKAAKASLVERIGKHLPEARTRIVDRVRAIGGDPMVVRVEQVYQRKVDAWLAPDVARLYAEVKAVEDGMAMPDEVWPTAPAPEPRRSDQVTDVEENRIGADPPSGTDPAADSATPPLDPGAPGGASTPASPPQPAPPQGDWRVPDGTTGQDAIVKKLNQLLAASETPEEVDAIERLNADRISKFGLAVKSAWTNAVKARRQEVARDE